MVITYHGVECFRVQFGNTTLAFNPISKDSKFKTTRFGADIVLVSLNHPDFNGVGQVARGDKEPFEILGPGEYQAGGVSVRGFACSSEYGTKGAKRRVSTVYVVLIEDMKLCFLGPISSVEISAEVKEALDDLDVLFVPIGGSGVLDPKNAHDVNVRLEPQVVIPMHYHSADALKIFLKEEGDTNGTPVDKLTLKRKDLTGKDSCVVVLDSAL